MNGGQQARQPMAHSRLAALVANGKPRCMPAHRGTSHLSEKPLQCSMTLCSRLGRCKDDTFESRGLWQQRCTLLIVMMLCAVDEEDANANNMEAEASGSDAEAAEQDDIEQHAPGGRRAGPHASSAAANGHRRDGEDNADPDVAVCLWPYSACNQPLLHSGCGGSYPPCICLSCLPHVGQLVRQVLPGDWQAHGIDGKTAVQNNRDGRREDWEHEEERQDDDVDMEGEDAEDGEPSPSPPRWGLHAHRFIGILALSDLSCREECSVTIYGLLCLNLQQCADCCAFMF